MDRCIMVRYRGQDAVDVRRLESYAADLRSDSPDLDRIRAAQRIEALADFALSKRRFR